MAKTPRERPVFHPEIGAYLTGLREGRKWSQLQAVSRAKERGLSIGVGQLRFLEGGLTKHPDAELLAAVASLYEVPYRDLAQRFIAANYGPDLVHVAADQESRPSPTEGGGPLAQHPDLQQAHARLEEYKAAHAAIVVAANRLLALIVADGEITDADGAQPRSGRGGRRHH